MNKHNKERIKNYLHFCCMKMRGKAFSMQQISGSYFLNVTKLYYYCVATVLIAFILLMGVLKIFIANKDFSDLENRPLEQKPNFSVESLADKKFATSYGNYISDQFPYRNSFVNLKSNFQRLLGIKCINDVYLGRDGYLLQKFNKPTDAKGLTVAVNYLNKKNPKLKTYVMLVPNSCEILKDKLPKYAPNEDELKYINEIKKGLNKKIKFVNIYDELKNKKNEYLFFKTDHHWTPDAAYYAYKKFMGSMGLKYNKKNYYNIKTVTNDFYGTLYSKVGFDYSGGDNIKTYVPKIKQQYKVEFCDGEGLNSYSDTLYKNENLKTKDKYTVFLGGNHPLIKITTKAKTDKKILILRDSYANCFVPFLTSHFKEIYMVDLRYYSDDVNKLIAKNKIDNALILYNVITFFEDKSIENLEALN